MLTVEKIVVAENWDRAMFVVMNVSTNELAKHYLRYVRNK